MQQDTAGAIKYILSAFPSEAAATELAHIAAETRGDYWLYCDMPDYLPPGPQKNAVLSALIQRGWLYVCPEQADGRTAAELEAALPGWSFAEPIWIGRARDKNE